ncbi:DUF4377 domain-containing protein [Aequorivita marina]|uniref:DUF4377 domain-containing protein n=1 Tax=Aequorivita marina TaxID=3073654 RepID=UPI0028743BE3|nr:DUF4377 domain-containing protein [Aequorivita sp. S2608]MDS1297629.1 DUF4377 domain-containing protein [Aequorivita sp. S2608]
MKLYLALFIAAFTVNACKVKTSKTTPANQMDTILYVNSEKVDCTGLGPMKCLQFQESKTLDPEAWQLFYDQIEGFHFQPGFVYKLYVRKEKIPASKVPADASSLKYTLLKVIEKNKTADFLLDDIWAVKTIKGEKVKIRKNTSANQDYALVLDINLLEMKILGYDGCNNFYGSIKTFKKNKLNMAVLGATKKLCKNMETPSSFRAAIEEADCYTFKDGSLYFYNTEGNEVLELRKAD